MKQTPVEWFAEQVEQHILTFGNIQPNVITKLKNLSKQMEKEQIIKAMSVAFIDGLKSDAVNYESPYEDWEQYYNETYKTTKQ